MLRLFKRSLVLYNILAIPGLVGIIIVVWKNGNNSLLLLLAFPLMFIWPNVAAYIANIYAIKLEGKVKAELDECNTKDFIEFYRKALEKRNLFKLKDYTLMNLSTGHLVNGNNEMGKCILDKFNGFPNTKRGVEFSVGLYNNLAVYYLRVNELDKAEDALKNMKEALENPKFNKKRYKNYIHLYNYRKVMLSMYRGNYDGVEEYFNKNFDEEKTLLGKVSTKYCLGELYIRLGDNEKALSAFEFILKNGNDTYYTKRANEYLGKPLEVT